MSNVAIKRRKPRNLFLVFVVWGGGCPESGQYVRICKTSDFKDARGIQNVTETEYKNVSVPKRKWLKTAYLVALTYTQSYRHCVLSEGEQKIWEMYSKYTVRYSDMYQNVICKKTIINCIIHIVFITIESGDARCQWYTTYSAIVLTQSYQSTQNNNRQNCGLILLQLRYVCGYIILKKLMFNNISKYNFVLCISKMHSISFIGSNVNPVWKHFIFVHSFTYPVVCEVYMFLSVILSTLKINFISSLIINFNILNKWYCFFFIYIFSLMTVLLL